jgi:predicted metal-dependent phosphoesterase TrpH
VLRVDLHLHSHWSPDSRTTLEQLIERADEVGLDRIALTDHNTAEGALELAGIAPQLAIVGEEVRTTEGEIIGLFIERSIPRGLSSERVCDLVHEMGGLTYFPHPFDRFRANFSAHRLVDLADRIDIIEVYNPWARAQDNQAAAQICAELGKVAATGSDAHGTAELGQSWMEMEEYAGPADFLAKLASARHVVTAQSGTQRRA